MDANSKRRRPFKSRGRLGCGGFVLVLTLGIALSLFGADLGVGLSVRIPLTDANATVAASMGAKGKAAKALPDYTFGRLGNNGDFINGSQTMTIGPAEGATLAIVGKQEGAPAIDVHIVVR